MRLFPDFLVLLGPPEGGRKNFEKKLKLENVG